MDERARTISEKGFGRRKVLTIRAFYTIIMKIDKNVDGESKRIANVSANRGECEPGISSV